MRGTDNGQQAAALEPSDGMDPKTSLRIALNLLIWCFNCDFFFCSCGCVTMTAALKQKKTPHKQGCGHKGGCESNNSATINRKMNQNKNVTLLAFIANEG